MSDEDLWGTLDPEAQSRLHAIGELTLNQVRDMVHGRTDVEEIIIQAANAVAKSMLGKPTLEVATIGLTLTMLGLDLYGKGHLNISDEDEIK